MKLALIVVIDVFYDKAVIYSASILPIAKDSSLFLETVFVGLSTSSKGVMRYCIHITCLSRKHSERSVLLMSITVSLLAAEAID